MLKGSFKGHLDQPSYHEQEHLQLCLAAQSPSQPNLGYFQGWGIYHLSGQPVPEKGTFYPEKGSWCLDHLCWPQWLHYCFTVNLCSHFHCFFHSFALIELRWVKSLIFISLQSHCSEVALGVSAWLCWFNLREFSSFRRDRKKTPNHYYPHLQNSILWCFMQLPCKGYIVPLQEPTGRTGGSWLLFLSLAVSRTGSMGSHMSLSRWIRRRKELCHFLEARGKMKAMWSKQFPHCFRPFVWQLIGIKAKDKSLILLRLVLM